MRTGRGKIQDGSENAFFHIDFSSERSHWLFLLSTWVFFHPTSQNEIESWRPPCQRRLRLAAEPSGHRFRAEIGLSVWRRKETKYASSDTAAEPSPPLYTHQHTRASIRVRTQKTRYFAALRTLFPSHFLIFFHREEFRLWRASRAKVTAKSRRFSHANRPNCRFPIRFGRLR